MHVREQIYRITLLMLLLLPILNDFSYFIFTYLSNFKFANVMVMIINILAFMVELSEIFLFEYLPILCYHKKHCFKNQFKFRKQTMIVRPLSSLKIKQADIEQMEREFERKRSTVLNEDSNCPLTTQAEVRTEDKSLGGD